MMKRIFSLLALLPALAQAQYIGPIYKPSSVAITGGAISGTSVAATTLSASSTTAAAGTVTIKPTAQTNPGTPGYGLNVVAADAASATISMDSAAVTGGTLVFRKANTTLAAPSNHVSGDVIGRMSGRGYEASQYSGTAAAVDFKATQTWTNSAAGTQIVFSTVPNSSTTLTTGMTLDQDQSLTVVGPVSGSTAKTGTASLTLAAGALGLSKMAADGAAPGAGGGKLQLVCGTNAGTAKLVISAGTSATTITITDNIGAGVTGC